MLCPRLRYAICCLAFAATSGGCCRRPTESTVVGTWKDPKYPVEVTFHADHSLWFTNSRISSSGTWNIAGEEFIVIFEEASHPGDDTMHMYTKPKICGRKFYFGPSRMIGRRHGQQIGETDTQEGSGFFERVR